MDKVCSHCGKPVVLAKLGWAHKGGFYACEDDLMGTNMAEPVDPRDRVFRAALEVAIYGGVV